MRFETCGIPNCVPEYYRSMFEDEAHEAEKEMERIKWYEKNKEYRDKKFKEGCAEILFPPVECKNCNYGEAAMPTSEDDDMEAYICSNWKNCSVFRKDMEEHFPDVPWEEIRDTWFYQGGK